MGHDPAAHGSPTRRTTTMRVRDVRAAANQLRGLLDAIDTGQVEATPNERAHLAGALDALGRVTGSTAPTGPVAPSTE